MASGITVRSFRGGRDRRMYLLAGLLAVILAILLLRMNPSDALARGDDKAGGAGSLADAIKPSAMALVADVDMAWPATLHRDLFVLEVESPLVEPMAMPTPSFDSTAIRQEANAVLNLQAIVYGLSPRAVVNGREWRSGQTIAGYRIQRIARQHIVVEKEGVEIEVHISG